MPAPTPPPRHALSIDVEDWYHDGGAPAGTAPAERVVYNTERLLELLAAAGARATFFFLGDVAERHPALVRRTAAAGHEIASHGHRHDHLSRLQVALVGAAAGQPELGLVVAVIIRLHETLLLVAGLAALAAAGTSLTRLRAVAARTA